MVFRGDMDKKFAWLKDAVKEAIAWVFRYSGIPILMKLMICRKRVTIILYHNPSAKVFEKHLGYLSKNFEAISLDTLVDAIYRKDWSKMPKRSLVITIDDGFKENYELLKTVDTYKVRPTIYVCSHIVGTNRKFWFESTVGNPGKMMKYENQERLKALQGLADYQPDKEFAFRQALSLEELKEMRSKIDIQSHSKYHPVLPQCSDSESRREIEDSRRCLETLLEKPVEHFSYPNGDYDCREIAYLKSCGYKSARTVDLGWNDLNTDPFKLKAMGIQDDASVNVLAAQIFGFFGYLRFMLKGSFNGRHPKYA